MRIVWLQLLPIVLAISVCGCGPAANSGNQGSKDPLNFSTSSEEPNSHPPIFVDSTNLSGLTFEFDAGPIDDYFFPAIMGGGAALLDFDNDGDLDIYLINGNHDHAADSTVKPTNRLFEQLDTGKFQDVTERSGLGDTGYGMGVAVADVNNDGFVDVYVTNLGADQLFLNQQDGTFRDVTEAAGVDNLRWGVSATFLDFDRDGWLDLYVTNYVNFFPSRKCTSRDGRADFCSPSAFPGTIDKLYRNLGASPDGSVQFKDVTVDSGVAVKRGPGLGVISGDFNADGWPDLYVANDGAANFLWINQKNGTFEDEAVYRGAALDRQGSPQAGMGVAAADLNADQKLDLLVTHLGGESNALYLSSDLDFQEDSVRCGLGVSSFQATGFGVGFVDLEHDGDEDVVIANGRVTRPPRADPKSATFWETYAEPNQILIAEADCRFVNIQSSTDAFLEPRDVSRGLCVGDIDNDGDMDLLVANISGAAKLYTNQAKKAGRWLMVSALEPKTRGNRFAYGATIRLMESEDSEKASAIRYVNPGSSYCASNDPRVHFGLGEASFAGVEVQWVDGTREWFEVREFDRAVSVTRGTGVARD